MITFITTLKPFNKLFKPLQINAINSWYNLNEDKKIIINTEYIDEVKEYFSDKLDDIIVLPHKRLTTTGVPYVSDIFYSAYDHTNEDDALCYINADIILINDFVDSVNFVLSKEEFKNDPYLMAGKRWNWNNGTEFTKLHDFSNREEIKNYVNTHISKSGSYDVEWATDYFVHCRSTYKDKIPNDLILGRCVWDIWLSSYAVKNNYTTVDLTKTAFIIHPKHAYGINGVQNIPQLKKSNKEIQKEFQSNKKYKCPGKGKSNQFKFFTKYTNEKIGIHKR